MGNVQTYTVRAVDVHGREIVESVEATHPDEAMTIVERGGFDYVEAEVSIGGEQVAVYDAR
jgi:hypothetical protein